MQVTLEGGCRVSNMHDGEPLAEGTLRIWNQIGRTSGAQAISLRIMEFAPGLSPTIRNGDCDEILYVLDESFSASADDPGGVGDGSQGQARSARPLDHIPLSGAHPEGVRRDSRSPQISINCNPNDISANTGIYIRPHETFVIDNPEPDSVVLVSCRCPEPDDQQIAHPPITQRLAPATQPALVRLADRPAQPTADRWYRVLVDDEIGSTQATQFVGSIPPGRAPDHFHNYEEVLFILRGEGRMWAGETNTPIAPGSCIYLPKGQVHCVENTGEDELRLLGVFYPAGSPSVRYDV